MRDTTSRETIESCSCSTGRHRPNSGEPTCVRRVRSLEGQANAGPESSRRQEVERTQELRIVNGYTADECLSSTSEPVLCLCRIRIEDVERVNKDGSNPAASKPPL